MKQGIIILVLLAGFNLQAQIGKLKKADNYYAKVAYAEAAKIYIGLIDSEVDGPTMMAKLANCFYQMGQTNSAEKYYAEMISSAEATSQDVYNYAQALKENGEYLESDKWMEKFHSMNLIDSRGIQFNKNKEFLQQLRHQDAYFSIKNLNLNTSYSEYGGYPYKAQSFFISNRPSKIAVQRYHSWNDRPFFDLYSADVALDSELENTIFLENIL